MNIQILSARMSSDQKLTFLRMPIEGLESFCSLYVRDRRRYLMKHPGGEWFQVNNKRGRPVPLTNPTVCYHLMHKYWVAVFPSKYANFVCFDLDPSPDQEIIYGKIKQWVKYPMAFRSSSRAGLHLYCHLAFPIEVEKLLHITKATCKKLDINISPGICEIFPRPNSALRLPLGQGSLLLNPDSLSPICTDVATAIRYISENVKSLSFQDLFPQLARRRDERKRLQERGL
jgi:hypothetical protein